MATKTRSLPSRSASVQRGEKTRARILKYVEKYWVKYGCAPSLTEIAEGVGLSTHNAVRTHLLALKAEGKVSWQAGRQRTLRLL